MNSHPFDHLVGEGEQGRRNGKIESPGGLQVDDKLKFGGQLNGQLHRLRATQTPPGSRTTAMMADAAAAVLRLPEQT